MAGHAEQTVRQKSRMLCTKLNKRALPGAVAANGNILDQVVNLKVHSLNLPKIPKMFAYTQSA